MPRSVVIVALLVAAGCQAPAMGCPRGTVPTSRGCVSDAPPPPAPLDDGGAPPAPESDAGTATPPSSADGGWTLEPPGSPPPRPGCTESTGQCDAWETELLGRLAAERACSSPLLLDATVQAVAQRHSDHQAELDRLTASSPEGTLFEQLRREGATFRDAAAAFSVTREGAADVMARWLANPETAPLFDDCWTHAGVAFATSASGASYATVILLAR